MMKYPETRPRRLRATNSIRSLVRETVLTPYDFIQPLFVVPGNGIKKEISSLPGQYQFSIDTLVNEVDELCSMGLNNILLFGVPEYKDPIGSSAWDSQGIIQRASRELKERFADIQLIADVCFCEYTDHGHCGVLCESGSDSKELDNDSTLKNLAKQAVSLAQSGIDMMAPSGNIDGMVGAIRNGLDINSFTNVSIMSYAVKYHSSFYGPFREAVGSAPSFGDRQSYQMDPANSREAIKEVQLDVDEGADIVMVKPALSYLDIICKVKKSTNIPVAAYNVSGEYAMLVNAAKNGLIDRKRGMWEVLTSMKRAGADIIISYFSKEAVREIA